VVADATAIYLGAVLGSALRGSIIIQTGKELLAVDAERCGLVTTLHLLLSGGRSPVNLRVSSTTLG